MFPTTDEMDNLVCNSQEEVLESIKSKKKKFEPATEHRMECKSRTAVLAAILSGEKLHLSKSMTTLDLSSMLSNDSFEIHSILKLAKLEIQEPNY